MNKEQLVNDIRKAFARILYYDRKALIDILNKNAFVCSYDCTDDEVTVMSLKALQLSNNYRQDLAELIAKYYTQSKKVGFAAQPVATVMITMNDLCFSQPVPNEAGKTFIESNIWAKNL